MRTIACAPRSACLALPRPIPPPPPPAQHIWNPPTDAVPLKTMPLRTPPSAVGARPTRSGPSVSESVHHARRRQALRRRPAGPAVSARGCIGPTARTKHERPGGAPPLTRALVATQQRMSRHGKLSCGTAYHARHRSTLSMVQHSIRRAQPARAAMADRRLPTHSAALHDRRHRRVRPGVSFALPIYLPALLEVYSGPLA